MPKTPSPRPTSAALADLVRSIAAVLALLILAWAGAAGAEDAPLRVAVYDVPPYGQVEPDGSIDGVSVDLWRRTAGALGRQYRLIPVSEMEAILEGLERNEFDVASGAISAFLNYGAVVTELSPLIAFTAALLAAMGVAMWLIERPLRPAHGDAAVTSLRDGVYWAVVTMTTVGYGDKTPKTTLGRMIAIVWMLVSVALVSILSTTLVSKMTAERVAGVYRLAEGDLDGKRLAAVAHSSGAEYIDERRLPYAPFDDLPGALTALAAGRADAVVNSVGALQYLVAARFSHSIEAPDSVLAPAYMAFALPRASALKQPLDRALIEITASREWRRVEQSYFGK